MVQSPELPARKMGCPWPRSSKSCCLPLSARGMSRRRFGGGLGTERGGRVSAGMQLFCLRSRVGSVAGVAAGRAQ